MRGKGGWIRILEATIAVLIVSGAMIAVYSGQSVRQEATIGDYSYSLQSQILENIASRSDLRLDALRTMEDYPGDPNYDRLEDFVNQSIPDSFGYLLRVCDLGDENDYCKMDAKTFIASLGEDVFVEDVIISAEIGNGMGDEVYSPKKVRLFLWEGGLPDGFCRDTCPTEGDVVSCSDNFNQVISRTCVDSDGDGCLEYVGTPSVAENCDPDESCIDGVCTNVQRELICRGPKIVETGCVHQYDTECNEWDGGHRTGSCGTLGFDDSYECWNNVTEASACEANPSCPTGSDPVYSRICDVGCADECNSGDTAFSCSADLSRVMVQTCRNYDADPCLEYGTATTNEICSSDEHCSGAGCIED